MRLALLVLLLAGAAWAGPIGSIQRNQEPKVLFYDALAVWEARYDTLHIYLLDHKATAADRKAALKPAWATPVCTVDLKVDYNGHLGTNAITLGGQERTVMVISSQDVSGMAEFKFQPKAGSTMILRWKQTYLRRDETVGNTNLAWVLNVRTTVLIQP